MKKYITRIKNGGLKENEMQQMFDEMTKYGYQLENMCAAGGDSLFTMRVYFVFSKEI